MGRRKVDNIFSLHGLGWILILLEDTLVNGNP